MWDPFFGPQIVIRRWGCFPLRRRNVFALPAELAEIHLGSFGVDGDFQGPRGLSWLAPSSPRYSRRSHPVSAIFFNGFVF